MEPTTPQADARASADQTTRAAVARFDALPPDGAFVLATDRAPSDVLRVLQAQRPDAFEWSVLEASDGCHRVEIRRRDAGQPRGPSEYLTWDHRRLDAILERVQAQVGGGDLAAAARLFGEFAAGLDHHIVMEEEVLFPLLEKRAPMAMGPTRVMRHEHVEIRRLLREITEALGAASADGFARAKAELEEVLGAHNMKEEHILYPMSDQTAGGASERAELVRHLQAS